MISGASEWRKEFFKNMLICIVIIVGAVFLGVQAQKFFSSKIAKYEAMVEDTFGQCKSYDVVTDGKAFSIRQGAYVSVFEFPTKSEAEAEAVRRKVECEEAKAHREKQWTEVR